MKTNIKIVYFIFLLQFIVYWLLNSDFKTTIFWIINLIILLIWLFIDDDFGNIKKYLKVKYEKLSSSVFDEEEKNAYNILWQILFYFTKHYLFVLSFFILFVAFLNTYFFDITNLDIRWSLFRFLLFTVINIKNVYNWEIYFWYKKLYQKDLYFVLSLIIVFRTFSYIKDVEFYTRITISFVLWSLFYFLIIKVSWLDKFKKFFSMFSVRLYLFFDIVILWFYLVYFVPTLKNYFIEEKIVYQDKIIEKPIEKIVYVYTWNQEFTWNHQNLSGSSLTGDIFTGDQFLTWYEDLKLKKSLTYYDVLPYLVEKYQINPNSVSNVVFDNVSIKDPNYAAFKVAYSKKIFGTSSDPKSILKCQNLIVTIWLFEWWTVQYTKDTVFDEYWKRAQRNWVLNKTWCVKKDDLITYQNLIF